MADAMFFGADEEEDTSARVSDPVFFDSSEEEDTSSGKNEEVPPVGREQGESPIPLTSNEEAKAKGDMGITEYARKSYEAATGAEASENPILAQIANMGNMVGGRLNANIQMKAAQDLATGGNYSDEDIDRKMDAMIFGGVSDLNEATSSVPTVAGPGVMVDMAFHRKQKRPQNEIMRNWDETEGKKFKDPEERRIARMKYAGDIATAFIKDRAAVQENAQTELDNRETTTGANLVTEGLKQLSYMAPYMLGPVGIGLQFLEEGEANKIGYMTNRYGYDESGKFRLVREGDDETRATVAGFGTAGIETASEIVGGKLGMAAVKGGGRLLGALGGKLAGETIGRFPIMKRVGEKVAGKAGEYVGEAVDKFKPTKVGQAAMSFGKGLKNTFAWTSKHFHLENPIEEGVEELEGDLLNNLTGWDRRESEVDLDDMGRKMDYANAPVQQMWDRFCKTSEFFKPKNIVKLYEGMALTMGGGAFVAHCARRGAVRDVDNLIRRNDLLTEEELKSATLEQKSAAIDAWANGLSEEQTVERIRQASGWMENLLNSKEVNEFASEVNGLREKMQAAHDYNTGAELDRLNLPRQKFNIPWKRDEKGKPLPDFKQVITCNLETGESAQRNAVYDESGICMADNEDDGKHVYSVYDPHGKNVGEFETIPQAITKATGLKNDLLLERAKDRMKQQFIEREVAANYKGAKVIDVKTIDDALKASMEISGEDIAADSNFSPWKSAWRLNDGTIVLVRDNIANPGRLKTILRHEAVGHSEKAMSNRFIEDIYEGQESVAERAKRLHVDGRKMRNALREAVAIELQSRRHAPGVTDKLVHGVRNIVKKSFGIELPMTNADLEVEVAAIEKEIREGADGSRVSRDMTTPTQTFAEGAQGAAGEAAEEETGKETSEAPEALTGDSGASDDGAVSETETTEVPDVRTEFRKTFLDKKYVNEGDKSIFENGTDDELAEMTKAWNDVIDGNDVSHTKFNAVVQKIHDRIKSDEEAASKAAGVRTMEKVSDLKSYIESKSDLSEEERTALDKAVVKVANADDMMQIGSGDKMFDTLLRHGSLMLLKPHTVDKSDAHLPNFKLDVNPKTGIGKPLEGKWIPSMGGFGVVWMKQDGTLVQGTGRHRSNKADEADAPMWNIVLREADGWTKDKVSLIDGIFNIKDGKGSIADYVRFFEDSGFRREDAEEYGLLGEKTNGLAAWSIYADATHATRDATDINGTGEDGKITVDQASVIAQAAPKGADKKNAAIQAALVRKAKTGMHGAAFSAYCREMARSLRNGKIGENLLVGEQMDLFADESFLAMEKLAEARGKYRAKKSDEYVKIARALRDAVNNGTRLNITEAFAKDLGITDKTDKKQLQKALETAQERAQYWDPTGDRVLDEADVAAMDAAINEEADAKAAKLKKVAEMRSGKATKKASVAKTETTEKKVDVAKTATTTPATTEEKSAVEKPAKKVKGKYALPDGVTDAQAEAFRDRFEYEPFYDGDAIYREPSKVDGVILDESGKLVVVHGGDGLSVFGKGGSEIGGFVGSFMAGDTISDATKEKIDEIVGNGSKSVGEASKKSTPKAERKRTVKMKSEEDENAAKSALDAIDFMTDDIERPKQGALSGGTSRNQNPSGNEYGKKWHIFRTGTRNVDIGAGRFNKATEFLKDIGVTNLPFDPVNRSREENAAAAEAVRKNPADTATVHNVLNVIDNDAVLDGIVNQAARAIKSSGRAIFTIYEGNRSGNSTPTRDGFQRNWKAAQYVPHIQKYFGQVETHGNVILASRPKDVGPAFWAFDSKFVDGIDFMTDDFDYEKFGKIVTGVGKLVDVLSRNGHTTFESLARYISENDVEKFAKAEPVLQDVWNAVAKARGLKRVSDDEAASVYGIIKKETEGGNDGRATGDNQRRDAGDSGSLGGALSGNDVAASSGEESRGEGVSGVEGRAEKTVQGARGGSGRSLGNDQGGRDNPSGRGRRGGESVKDGGASGENIGSDRRAVPVQRGEASGEQRASSDGVDAGAQGDQGGLDAGRSERGTGERGSSGVPESATPSVKRASKKAADEKPGFTDFVMTPAVEEAILERNQIKRVRNNIAALKLLQQLKERDFKANPDEQAVLAKYVGWGGLSEIFSRDYERAWNYEKNGMGEQAKDLASDAKYGVDGYEAYKEIRQTLNDEEYEAAKQTVLTAFYTPIQMVRLEHAALRKLGVLGGRFLGPSAGVGNYASAQGEYTKAVNWQFVEKDQVSGQILRALFPNQRVHIGGFEETKIADSFFDAAIDNVPYADIDIKDKALGNTSYKIHDYFFAKALSKIRPGGVIMFLTSTGTLDKTDGKLRQYLSQHGGKIIGAVRLPNGFFSKNAGTDVASDLVIIQKVNGEADNSAFMQGEKYAEDTEWVSRKGQVKVDLTFNKYFADHPEQVIGEMKAGTGPGGRPMLEYKMPSGDMFAKVGEAIDRVMEGVDRDMLMKSAPAAVQKDHTPIYDDEGLRQGNITVKNGKVYEKSGDELVEVALPKLSETQKKRLMKKFLDSKKIVEKVIGVRSALRSVVDAEVAGVPDDQLQPLIDGLNAVYDDFVKKVGTFHDKMVTPFVMLDKADGNRLMTMEKVTKLDGNDVIEKADILKKRVIFTYQKPTKAETTDDAITIAFSETGALDMERIGELLGVSAEEAETRLKEEGRAFENPQTGMVEPHWEYLSGHVRRKLDAARAAMANDASFRKNVEALEKVQPKDVSLDEVTIKFGATWVDQEAMVDFLREVYDLPQYARVNLEKNATLGKWNLELPRSNMEPFGTISFTQEHFLQAVLNSESIEVRAKDPVTEKYYVLERETEAQKLAAEKLHEAFARYLRTNEKWFEPSGRAFNLMMNDNVQMELPKDILPLRAAGMTEDTIKKLNAEGREYQPAVIARGVLGGRSLCLAHCVGAGKTLEMQSIGMVGRHLGMFKKSMYVVPNHMLDQFCNEFIAAFPNANILKMSTEDVKPENRRAFFAKVANGDWDAIVVKHSTFSQKLPMTEEWQKEYMEKEVRRLTDAKLAAKGDKATVKDIEKMIAKAKEKIKKLDNSDRKDNEIVPFEELGVDQLFVDEAHNFKGLPVVSSQARKVKGLAQGDSQRALDMEMKTQYVQSLHGGRRGVVFATGTPLSNAPVVEAYVMLRYLAPWALEEQGVNNFDDFVGAFGQITTESEFGIDGKSTKEVERVTAFVNIPEMMHLFKSTVDIVNSDQIKVKRPKQVLEAVPVPMSDAQAAIMEMVANESAIPPSKEERSKFLTLSGIAKRACISPRLVGVDDDGNKLAAVAAKVKQVYDETSDVRGAQLVFSDIFNSSDADGVVRYVTGVDGAKYTGGTWNLNNHLRDLLVRSGIPSEQIGIIHDVDKAKGGDEGKDAAKEALFTKVRSGEIRVLIGSRPRMGEGTNVQERLAAIHLVHPGWKPSEDTQAIGRIIRPGNIFESGKVFYYLTQGNKAIGSYETKNHELIGVKDRLIQAVMHGDESVRTIDMDEAAAERDMLMGLASANQDLIKLIDVKRALHKAELNIESVAFSARSNADNATRTERALEKSKEDFAEQEQGAKEWREKNPDGAFVLTGTDGRTFDKVKDMADYIGSEIAKELVKDRYDREDRKEIGNFGGVALNLNYDYAQNKLHISVPSIGIAREVGFSGFVGDFNTASMTAFKTKILNTVSPDIEQYHAQVITDTENRIKRLRTDAERFKKEYEQEKEKLVRLRTEKERLERAVTPLIVQTTEDHKYTTYGNWAIVKNSRGYSATRMSDHKEVSSGSVKNLIPMMDAEDFGTPGMGSNKTTDLLPMLKSRGKEADVKSFQPADVDFMTDDTKSEKPKMPYVIHVFGPFAQEDIPVSAVSLPKACGIAKYKHIVPKSDWGRKPTPIEAKNIARCDVQPVSVNGVSMGGGRKFAIIRDANHARTIKKSVLDWQAAKRASEQSSSGVRPGEGRSSVGTVGGNGRGDQQGGLGDVSRLGVRQGTFADLGVDFMTDDDGVVVEGGVENTPETAREVYGMTNDEIVLELKAAGMEPMPGVRKSDERLWEQAETLYSNSQYMDKLSYAAAKMGRPLKDYENVALSILFRVRQEEVNRQQEILDELYKAPTDDPEIGSEIKRTKDDLKEAKAKMYETATAMTKGASEQGRALRSNRVLLDKYDLSFAGIMGEIAKIVNGTDNIPEGMEDTVRELAKRFKELDEESRALWSDAVKAEGEKMVRKIKSDGKMRKASEPNPENEGKRVLKNYLHALAQIEVHSAEIGGTLIGLPDQMQPGWGKWLRAIGEYYCHQNPDITEDECFKAITEDVNKFLDGNVTIDDVRDAATGFGHNYKQSRWESQRKMNDLRSQALKKRQLAWMDENNTLPPQTGMQRDDPSQETRRLAKEVQERKKDTPEGGANTLKGYLQSKERRLSNQIEDAKREIEELTRAIHDKTPLLEREKSGGRTDTNMVIETLKGELAKKRIALENLKNYHNALFGIEEQKKTMAERIKAAEKIAERQLERVFDELARAHGSDWKGVFEKRDREDLSDRSAKLRLIRAQVAAAQRELMEIKQARYEYGLTPSEIAKRHATMIANREKRIMDLAGRIERGDVSPIKKATPPMSGENLKRYEALARQQKLASQRLAQIRKDVEMSKLMPWEKVGRNYLKYFAGMMTATAASVDRSAILRQGLKLTTAHPVTAVGAAVQAELSSWSEDKFRELNDGIANDPIIRDAIEKYGLKIRNPNLSEIHDVEMFSGRGMLPPSGVQRLNALIDGVPVVGKAWQKVRGGYNAVLENSERHYVTYLNLMASESYKMLLGAMPGATDFQKRKLAGLVNMLCGAGAMSEKNRHSINSVNDLVGHVVWSPNLWVSQVQQKLFMDVLGAYVGSGEGGADGNKAGFSERTAVAKEAAKLRLRAELVTVALGALMWILWSNDKDWDEFCQSDWIKRWSMLKHPTLGKTHIDLEMGERTFEKFISQYVGGEYQTGTGRTMKPGGFGARDIYSTFGRYFGGKLSPVYGNMTSLMQGVDYVGNPYGLKEFVSGLLPLSMQDVAQSAVEDSWSNLEAPVAMVMTMLGAGGNVYDESDRHYGRIVNPFLEAEKEYQSVENDENLDGAERQAKLDELAAKNPLLRDGVRDELIFRSRRGNIGLIAEVDRAKSKLSKLQKNENASDVEISEAQSEYNAAREAVLKFIREHR